MVFGLTQRELKLLRELLELFPFIPQSYHRANTRHAQTPDEESAALLEEALQEQRRHAVEWLRTILAKARPIAGTKTAVQLPLDPPELECLLQALNDVRVGSWVRLGSPDPRKAQPKELTPETFRLLQLLGLSERFQMPLLQALQGDDDPTSATP
jgi:hypothetical protein